MLKTIMVVNRVEGWENTVNNLRQQLISLERDIASFKNFCLDAQKKEDEHFRIALEEKAKNAQNLVKKDNKHLT